MHLNNQKASFTFFLLISHKKNLGLLNQKSKSLSHKEYIYCRYRICKQMYQIAAE